MFLKSVFHFLKKKTPRELLTITWIIKVEDVPFPLLLTSCCLKRKPQKLVPGGNLSLFEPQTFVPANYCLGCLYI